MIASDRHRRWRSLCEHVVQEFEGIRVRAVQRRPIIGRNENLGPGLGGFRRVAAFVPRELACYPVDDPICDERSVPSIT